jgi:MYXO-CTERM domain-containing protein
MRRILRRSSLSISVASLASLVMLASLGVGAASCSTSAPSAPAPTPVGSVAQAESDSFQLGSGRDGNITISGGSSASVNDYAAITAAVATGSLTLSVDTVSGFAVGNVIMIWQTVGLTAADAPSGTTTSINLDAKGAGQYEFARIQSISGTTITLTNPVINAYLASGAQIVRVPEYGTVTVSTSLIPKQPWDGTKGGVVAFFAQGTVTNTASINADGQGLRGGVVENAATTYGCTALDGFSVVGGVATGGAHKGEGLVPSAYATTTVGAPNAIYGRGNVSIGAGGGDCHNSGGGGGGHAAAGGQGGLTYQGETPVGSRAVGGIGGAPLTYTVTSKLSFGGGGGAGEENNGFGSNGGAGGGVVWIRAKAFAGAGTISANGASALSTPGGGNDGAGGGGAGGLVYLASSSTADCGGVSANGGNGGNTVAQHGPGGGGAGGYVYVNATGGSCTGGKLTSSGGAVGTAGGAARGGSAGSGSTATSGAAGSSVSCDPRTGKCGGCVDDSWCPGQHCQLATHSCLTCVVDSQCSAGFWCNTQTGTCTAQLSNSVAIPIVSYHSPALTGTCSTSVAAVVCASGVCETSDNECGLVLGDTCTSSAQCRSGDCSAAGICIASGTCAADADCGSGQWCNIAAGTCNGKLINGTKMPTDTKHGSPTLDGTCNGAAATLVCLSSVCDPVDNECGIKNGDPGCAAGTTDSKCRSGVCGADGSCGWPSGTPGCKAGGADGRCRSGLCDSAGICIDMGTCAVDGDCTLGFWCNVSAKTCTATLANGASLPTDTGHSSPTLDGTCGTGVGALVCQSGVCDPKTKTCGIATGDMTCTTDTQCISGHCKTATSTCVACGTDADCKSTEYCDMSGTCQPRQPDGSPCTAPDQCSSGSCRAGFCGGVVPSDAGDAGDAAETSDGATDAASEAAVDSGVADTGAVDTGVADSGVVDTGVADTGSVVTDAASEAAVDSGAVDSGAADAGADASAGDAAPVVGTVEGGGIDCAVESPGRGRPVGAAAALVAVGAVLVARRRRRD